MSKQLGILFLWIVSGVLNVRATTYFKFQFHFKYTITATQDSSLFVRLNLINGNNKELDSFQISSGERVLQRNYTFSNNFTADYIRLEVYNKSGKLLGNYISNGGCYSFRCNGYSFTNIFGMSCADFSSDHAGILCGDIKFHFVQDSFYDNIQTINGHFSDKFGIYCEYGLPNQEAPLKLSAPCYFSWMHDGKNMRWYESKTGTAPWYFIDTGLFIYPAKSSYHGGLFYNEKRYYKCVLDTNFIKGNVIDFESHLSVPIRFYLGAKLDSTVVINPVRCDQKPEIVLHYFNDSNSIKLKAPRVWVFFKASDTSPEYRWYLDTLQHSPAKLYGRKIYPQGSGPTPPSHLQITKGRYRIMYDFTPWNGFDCKLQFDTVFVQGFDHSFNPKFHIVKDIMCFGDSDAILQCGFTSHDTAQIWFSKNGKIWTDSNATLKNFHAGKQPIYSKSSRGCTVIDTIFFYQPGAFSYPFRIDTALCTDQVLYVDAYHPKAYKYSLDSAGKVLFSNNKCTLINSGNYNLTVENKDGCRTISSIVIKRRDLKVLHDFLIPAQAFLTDSVYAVNKSVPNPDTFLWNFSNNNITFFEPKPFTICTKYPDTGRYMVTLISRFKECGFTLSKQIHILGGKDTLLSDNRLGYKGPLIQDFYISPNPNDGENYEFTIKLRDTANVTVYKIDPVSGDVIGDIDFYNKKTYQSSAFANPYQNAGVFYLKCIAGNETKTIKVVVVK